MRADRLLSLLMLLQSRGRMTAQDLADELEVSVRTIYRDIDALSQAGIPVYCERGPGGGCALLDSYQTNLTGLNERELSALFMLSIPAPLSDLGMMDSLTTAIQKFSATLPDERRQQQAWIQQRFLLDWSWWRESDEPVPHLRTIQRAVWEDRELRLSYRMQLGPRLRDLERVVEPFGLVAKAGIWYLVCASQDRLRVFRVSEIAGASLLETTFVRPETFDLAVFWESWCAGYVGRQRRYAVTMRVAPSLVPYLPYHFGDQIQVHSLTENPSAADDWKTLTLRFDSLEDARSRLLGFGAAIEVIEPEPLRRSIVDFAEQVQRLYAHHPQKI